VTAAGIRPVGSTVNLLHVLMRSVLTCVVVSIVPGVIGALLGKGLGGLRDRRGLPTLGRC
jgi:hypothetical protein